MEDGDGGTTTYVVVGVIVRYGWESYFGRKRVEGEENEGTSSKACQVPRVWVATSNNAHHFPFGTTTPLLRKCQMIW